MYDAQQGSTSGAHIDMSTSSGTNQYHGSAYGHRGTNWINAAPFFFKNDGAIPDNQKNPELHRWDAGGTFGGPVVIPKVFHGKDKMFFFFGYQGQRLVQTQVNPQVTVFTPAELTGDFSHSNASGTGPDQNVVKFLQQNSYFQPNPGLAAQGTKLPQGLAITLPDYVVKKTPVTKKIWS